MTNDNGLSLQPEGNTLPILPAAQGEEKEQTKTLIKHPIKGDDWDLALPSEETQLRIQYALVETNGYPGKKNGNWGNLTLHAIQSAVGHHGAYPDADLCARIFEFAEEVGGLDTDEDTQTVLNEDIWEAFAEGLESGGR